eukprot:219629_1
MFNGSFTPKWGSDQVSADERAILSSLINWKLGQQASKIDRYVLDTFQSFCQNKQHIVFNYYSLGANDKYLRNQIFYEMERCDDFQAVKEEKTNIFRKELFQ